MRRWWRVLHISCRTYKEVRYYKYYTYTYMVDTRTAIHRPTHIQGRRTGWVYTIRLQVIVRFGAICVFWNTFFQMCLWTFVVALFVYQIKRITHTHTHTSSSRTISWLVVKKNQWEYGVNLIVLLKGIRRFKKNKSFEYVIAHWHIIKLHSF